MTMMEYAWKHALKALDKLAGKHATLETLMKERVCRSGRKL